MCPRCARKATPTTGSHGPEAEPKRAGAAGSSVAQPSTEASPIDAEGALDARVEVPARMLNGRVGGDVSPIYVDNARSMRRRLTRCGYLP